VTDSGYMADWPAPPGVRTWQTTRRGGVSGDAYTSLNLGAHVGDSHAAVTENRKRLRQTLELPAEPLWLEQVHGTRILAVDQDELRPADGAVTASVGTVLVVMTADCLPVLLAAEDGSEVGVAHAGWRGLADGVVERAVARFSAAPSSLMAWLGPAIGPGAFEVGPEVRQRFIATDAECEAAFTPNRRGRWQADLRWLAAQRLSRAGVAGIFGAPDCTFSDTERFFSHRRQAPCGRMATLIWLAEPR
jgi:YfiH family protein